MTTNPTITLDEQVALTRASARLAAEFTGVVAAETVERFLRSSFDELADTSTVARFLPLLAERFARQRLQALSRVEGGAGDGRPAVLFLCVHNAARSQMALGFFTHHAADRAVAWSEGPGPGPSSATSRSSRWPRRASTSPRSSPSRGPRRSSGLPTR